MKYIVGFLITIGLIILVIVLIVRGSGPSGPPKTPIDLTKYSKTDTTMQLTIDGAINAEQTHRAVRITVGKAQASAAVIQGYQGTIGSQKAYSNNPAAYVNFLRALQIAGFTKGSNDAAVRDERGFCPNGSRFILEIVSGDQNLQHYWTTSCGGQGNFKGNINTVRSLFQNQIPDYGTLASGTGL